MGVIERDYDIVRIAVETMDASIKSYYGPAFVRLVDNLQKVGDEKTMARLRELEYRLGLEHMEDLEERKP